MSAVLLSPSLLGPELSAAPTTPYTDPEQCIADARERYQQWVQTGQVPIEGRLLGIGDSMQVCESVVGDQVYAMRIPVRPAKPEEGAPTPREQFEKRLRALAPNVGRIGIEQPVALSDGDGYSIRLWTTKIEGHFAPYIDEETIGWLTPRHFVGALNLFESMEGLIDIHGSNISIGKQRISIIEPHAGQQPLEAKVGALLRAMGDYSWLAQHNPNKSNPDIEHKQLSRWFDEFKDYPALNPKWAQQMQYRIPKFELLGKVLQWRASQDPERWGPSLALAEEAIEVARRKAKHRDLALSQ